MTRYVIKRRFDYFLIGAIGLISLAYSLWGADFAQLHISLPFLNFPIFIGEILLFICGIVFILGLSLKIVHPRPAIAISLVIYILWLWWKAFSGYFAFGPLAFRNAALFYYPLFAVIGYFSFDSQLFEGKKKEILIMGLLILLSAHAVIGYYTWIYLMLISSLVVSLIKKKNGKLWLLAAIIMTIVNLPYIVQGSRSHLVGVGVALLILLVCLFFSQKRFSFSGKVLIPVMGISGFLLIAAFFVDKHALYTFFTPDKIIKDFQFYDGLIQKRLAKYHPTVLPPQLYSPNIIGGSITSFLEREKRRRLERVSEEMALMAKEKIENVIRPQSVKKPANSNIIFQQGTSGRSAVASSEVLLKDIKEKIKGQLKQKLAGIPLSRLTSEQYTELLDAWPSQIDKKEVEELLSMRDGGEAFNKVERQQKPISSQEYEIKTKEIADKAASYIVSRIKEFQMEQSTDSIAVDSQGEISSKPMRPLDIAYTNILFRLFIWRDMIREMIQERAWWGINFGKPQRSPSIEALDWASTEWKRDGWITPHNSFLHIIYRAGIVGIFLIGILLWTLITIIRDFVKMGSTIGAFLVSALVYWLTIANFLVILEFPYHAIPFWTLFGMTLAYRQRIVNVKIL